MDDYCSQVQAWLLHSIVILSVYLVGFQKTTLTSFGFLGSCEAFGVYGSWYRSKVGEVQLG